MSHPFLDAVQNHYSDLTRGQRQVADSLVRNPELLAFSTALDIGRTAGVSESTVIRLAYALGYRSFAEMQGEARQVLSAQRTRYAFSHAAEELPRGSSVLARVMENDARLVRQTLDQTSPESFERAVSLIVNARHIYVAGARSSYAVAVFLAYTLRTLLGRATLLEVDRIHFMHDLVGLTPEAVLLAIAFPRYTGSTVRIAEYAGRQNCPIVAITDNIASPLARQSNVVLTAAIDSPAATDSYVGALSLATTLLTAAALHHKQEVDRHLSRIEQVYADWNAVHT
ncbi:MAG: MurR/RpiR family transcriptional regulator [Bacillota bacterium]